MTHRAEPMAPSKRMTRFVVLLSAGLAMVAALACSASSSPSSPYGGSPAGDDGGTADLGSDPGASGSSGASTGGGTSGATSSSGSASSSGGARRDAAPSSGRDGGSAAAACSDANACDPRECTVCVPSDGGLDAAICLKGATATCGKNEATFHCASQADCATGESCCGSYNLSNSTLTTACHVGSCPAAAPLCGAGSQCQLCKTTQECASGTCIKQECNGSSVQFCSQNIFCTAL